MTLRGKTNIILIILLVCSISLSAAWSYQNQMAQAKVEMLEKARILSDEMDAVWEFIDINQPRIDTDSDGSYNFKGLYCAIAGKSIAKILERDTNYIIRYTNTTPRKNKSISDAYEAAAIASFNNEGISEVYSLETYEGKQVFRYVMPILLTDSCLDCHGTPAGELDITGYPKEGLAKGDVVGVTSIIMPVDVYMQTIQRNVFSQAVNFSIILIVVILIIYIMISRMITRPLGQVERAVEQIDRGDFNIKLNNLKGGQEIIDLATKFSLMAQQLRRAYSNLENQVEARTNQLASANLLLEQQRNQLAEINEELQKENQYKSDFLAIVSHELRTPLASIIAFAEMWEQSCDDEDEETTKMVSEVKGNGRLLLQMVNNILEMARLDAGRNELTLEPFDVVDLVSLVERSVKPLADQRDITMTSSVGSEVPIIISDWEKMRCILENLVSNAIKFTHRGGMVDINVDYDFDAGEVIIAVSDDGIGIEESELESIFVRFSQHDRSSNRRYKGSGLGLSVVKELVDLNGGKVSVKSEHKKGSTFTVCLPADIEYALDLPDS